MSGKQEDIIAVSIFNDAYKFVKTLIQQFTKKKKNFVFKIFHRYCKLVILGTLEIPGHIH